METEKIETEYDFYIGGESNDLMSTFSKITSKYAGSPPKDVGTKLSQDEMHQRIADDQEMVRRTEELFAMLGQKNRELEKFAVLLESVEPVPGIHPEKLLKLIENGNQNIDGVTDYRDVKIVALAKKCRNMNLALTKERSMVDKKTRENDELNRQCESLKREIELISSAAARAAATKGISTSNSLFKKGAGEQTDNNNDPAVTEQLKKELAHANKQLDDVRRKFMQSQEDAKKLERALHNDI